MKYCALGTCLLFIFSSFSCSPAQHDDTSKHEEPNPIVISSVTTLLRKAVVEHQFLKEADCKAAAKDYFNGQGNAGTPEAWSTNPIIYSFVEISTDSVDRKPREIRFKVGSVTNTDTIIISYEIAKKNPNPTNITNRRDIDEVIKDLRSKGFKLIQGPVLDAKVTNSKKSLRAIMNGKLPKNTVSKDSLQAKAKETFGIIINPPYP